MNVFRPVGYEKTSIEELMHEMGVAQQSLYDTFGGRLLPNRMLDVGLARQLGLKKPRLGRRIPTSSSKGETAKGR
jgi:hypothetical protein